MRIHPVPAIAAALLAVALAACGGERAEVEDVASGSSAADGAIAATSRDDTDAPSDTDEANADPATPRERHRRGDRSCARLVTRTRSVASVSGGAMQMIMVTECVPAKG
ncbi:hypothetical protein [Luteimonas sp. A482]